jgi:cation transport regulator ChaC
MATDSTHVWYFAYGSNLEPDRFRARVGPWVECRSAVLDNFRLRFSGEVRSEGGGGAFVEPAGGDRTYGAVYRIDREQLKVLDGVELSPRRNVSGRAERLCTQVNTPQGPIDAELYVLAGSDSYLAPSPTYLGLIVTGLRAVGHPDEVVERVRATAAGEPSA